MNSTRYEWTASRLRLYNPGKELLRYPLDPRNQEGQKSVVEKTRIIALAVQTLEAE
jgi:hypothetical protein